jgi:hypothetical protein
MDELQKAIAKLRQLGATQQEIDAYVQEHSPAFRGRGTSGTFSDEPKPGALSRIGDRLSGAMQQLVDDPFGTLGSMAKSAVKAPVESFMRTFDTPVVGEEVSPARYLRGKAGPLPGALPMGARITKENTPGAITPAEHRAAGLQTVVNAALPAIASRTGGALVRQGVNKFLSNAVGTGAAGAAAGAAYDPEDPLVGAVTGGITGAVLGPVGEGIIKGGGKLTSGVVNELGLRPSGKSAVEMFQDALKVQEPLGPQAQSATPSIETIFGGTGGSNAPPSAPTNLQRVRAATGRLVERATPIESAKTRALREVARRFSAESGDNVTRGDALAFADRAGDKPIMPLDLGAGNVAGLARMAKDTPGLGRRLIPEALHGRSSGVGVPEGEGATLQRVTSDFEKRIGLKPEDYFRSLEDMIKEQKANASADYGAIRNTLVDDPEVLSLFDIPEWRAVHERVRTNARVAHKGEVIPPLRDVSEAVQAADAAGVPDALNAQKLGTLDKVKRQLDKIIEGKAEGGPIDRDLAYSMRERLNEVLTRMDELHPEYGKARSRYRGSAEMMDAYKAGKEDFLTEDPRFIRSKLETLPERLQDLYRRGGYDALRSDKLMKLSDAANIGDALLKNPDIRARIEALAKSPEEATALRGDQSIEQAMGFRKNAILGGPNTAERLIEFETTKPRLTRAGEVARLIPGVGKAAGALVDNRLTQRAAGQTADVMGEVSKILTRPGRAGIEQTFDEVMQLLAADALRRQRLRAAGNVVIGSAQPPTSR